MSARSESATSPSPCACTNISLMQLFHELKQKFPGVPDHVVSNTIELYCHDKQACETHLHKEVKASLTHAYHASSSAAARQLNELKLNPPGKCRNQPIIKHEIAKTTPINSIICQGPQTAIISSPVLTNDSERKLNTDANQNVVEHTEQKEKTNNSTSPITTINIDKCFAKYNVESPSDIELTNESLKESLSALQEKDSDQSESTNYRILKSNKIRSNLHERLEKGKEKKTIKKVEPTQIPQERPKRPNTLDFIKPNPDIAFKQTLKEPEPEQSRTVSPAPSKVENQPKDANTGASYRTERGYPVNLSVNVNCHMDLSRYDSPWLEDYDSPRAITSVNLTVCTPTSNMASPIRETQENDGGFEGHVTVTVSPSTTRPTRRRAPPPPSQPTRISSPRPSRVAPEPPGTTMQDRSLIERQKERRDRLAKALEQEKRRLAQLTRETQILAAPPPPPSAAQALRDSVELLRSQCDMMSKKLEMRSSEPDDSDNFYTNIYTGQQPSAYWQCHLCTFRNFPLLPRCEECDMPRIYLVRAQDGITVRLMPGRRNITRSWVL
ncbi:TAK1-associated binding protein 2 isoform 2-T2 [Aphomia sociella]